MPVTRSNSSRSANRPASAPVVSREARQAVRKAASTKAPTKDGGKSNDDDDAAARGTSPAMPVVPAVLSFAFEDAKRHLVNVDARFADVFEKMQCRPFQQLQRIHPFRALVESILGQQISWMAARSINHKFKRLYDPSLPENATEYTPLMSASCFPTPLQVSDTDVPTLKTAGLSTRKAEYVKDLAARFADGRLSTEKLIAANDEELAEMLTAVRGIGRWTVDMFAIFSLRRPDILPVGDLGVQRGLIRWFLSLHSPSHPVMLSPKKLSGQSNQEKKDVVVAGGHAKDDDDDDELPVLGAEKELAHDLSSVPPAAGPATPLRNGPDRELPSMPPPFTPSINKTLRNDSANPSKLAPLPEGLSVAVLKGRLDGKKKIKGAMLTPKEMEDLTDNWRPYRSIGVYYMWSLAEQK